MPVPDQIDRRLIAATAARHYVGKKLGKVVHDPVADLGVVLIPRERHGGLWEIIRFEPVRVERLHLEGLLELAFLLCKSDQIAVVVVVGHGTSGSSGRQALTRSVHQQVLAFLLDGWQRLRIAAQTLQA
jgi:hypothetical protein